MSHKRLLLFKQVKSWLGLQWPGLWPLRLESFQPADPKQLRRVQAAIFCRLCTRLGHRKFTQN